MMGEDRFKDKKEAKEEMHKELVKPSYKECLSDLTSTLDPAQKLNQLKVTCGSWLKVRTGEVFFGYSFYNGYSI